MILSARFYLINFALALVSIGLNTFLDPVAAMAGIELTPDSVSALNEVRASYGGMQIGIGLVLLAGALKAAMLRPALWFSILIEKDDRSWHE